jgi:hypothetical protein
MPSGSLKSRNGLTLSHYEQVSQLSLRGRAPMPSITDNHSLFAQSFTPSTMAFDYSRVANTLWRWR